MILKSFHLKVKVRVTCSSPDNNAWQSLHHCNVYLDSDWQRLCYEHSRGLLDELSIECTV